jgi:hypothetical protein
MTKFGAAYGFRCGKSLDELRSALDATGPWSWVERDSALYPEYISTHDRKAGAVLRIGIIRAGVDFVASWSGEDFIIDLAYDNPAPNAKAQWETLHRDVVERLLPAISATQISPGSGFR